MIEIFDSITAWTGSADAANLARNTTDHLVGTGCLSFDKTGTSTTTASVTAYTKVPIPLYTLTCGTPLSLALSIRHANFTNFSTIRVSALYQGGSYDYWDTAAGGLSTGAWNTITCGETPTGSSGSPTSFTRDRCIGFTVAGIMGAAANTFSALLVDAIRLVGDRYSCLIFNGMRLPVPIFDMFETLDEETVKTVEAQTAVATIPLMSRILVRAGLNQARRVYDTSSSLHSLEDSLRLFDRYTAANHGWSLIHNGDQIVNTTITSAAAVGDTTIPVAASADIAYLSDACELRLGPNDSGQYEVVKCISRSTLTLTLDRPLFYAHESGTAVRSLGYFPALSRRKTGAATYGGRAGFNVEGVAYS